MRARVARDSLAYGKNHNKDYGRSYGREYSVLIVVICIVKSVGDNVWGTGNFLAEKIWFCQRGKL